MRKWLRQLRTSKGFSQKYVASKAYIDRTYYTQIENGTRTPSFNVATAISQTLDFSPSKFFTDNLTEPFETALKHAPITIAHCNLDLRYTWLFNPHPDVDAKASIGKKDDELASHQGAHELMALKQKVIDEGRAVRQTIYFQFSDGIHTYFVFGEPLRNDKGEIIGVVTASTDISNIFE